MYSTLYVRRQSSLDEDYEANAVCHTSDWLCDREFLKTTYNP